jgi:hypothetical protein
MSGRTGDDDRHPGQGSGRKREDPPFYHEAPPQQIGQGDGDSGQPQQRPGSTTPQRDAGAKYPGQQGGSSALDQELNRDDDGSDNGDELGENR